MDIPMPHETESLPSRRRVFLDKLVSFVPLEEAKTFVSQVRNMDEGSFEEMHRASCENFNSVIE
jgi:hypothetical protein